MGLDREQKRDFVAGLAQVFAETSMVVVTRNQGLTVAEATDLRRRMRAAGATFKVAKNRLATRALEGTPFTGIGPMLRGPTALAWAADPVAVAKAAVEYSRGNDKLVVVGGSLGARLLDPDGVRALAELPSLDQLRAGLVGLIATPATQSRGHPAGLGRPACPGFRRFRPTRHRAGGRIATPASEVNRAECYPA